MTLSGALSKEMEKTECVCTEIETQVSEEKNASDPLRLNTMSLF